MHKKFEHKEIEKKWQKKWQADQVYRTRDESNKPKTYVLDMFPYPSGEGLHVGHPKGYIATDIYSRYKRMTGHEVLHPMGWDAFGLPAENYAIKHKVHPRLAVEKNVAHFKEQLEVLGFDYDWSREINTTDPAYYKWTQWIFIQLLKKGLAHESDEPINWCPGCQTGLANEDLEADGTCERCGSVVEQKPMRQWVLKIREYADRMLEDLSILEWPEHIKEAQRNWIGRSEGAEIDFKLSTGRKVTVFTTRPDTLFGATYMVLAPELAHELTHEQGVIENWDEVQSYIDATAKKKEMDRLDVSKEKTGVKLEGIMAVNPANGEEIPVYVADYVLAGYGTGAIMAVPAHDERDLEFAKKYGIEIRQVVGLLFDQKPDIKKQRKAVYGLIENERGEFLLQFFKQDNYCWLPGGGIKEGETEEECLRREMEEESGFYEFSELRLLTTHFLDYTPRDKKSPDARNKATIFYAKVDSSKQRAIALTQGEIEAGLELHWLKPDNIEAFLSGTHEARAEFLRHVISGLTGTSNTERGILINSGEFDGMESEEAKKAITEKVGGRITSTYKIKDWVFSRQRYWGEPIPVVRTEEGLVYPITQTQLPVTLPEVEHYEPAGDGQSPLSTIEEWVNVTGFVNEEGDFVVAGEAPTGTKLLKAKRETNTMPQWAGSSWYYLRYMDPENESELVSKEHEQKWAPVDVYVGGDHAVRHLIYVRFWHKFLYDIGVVSTVEPFQRLEFLGFILAEDGRKMSKRWGNVINPDDVVELVGADTLRLYEMFMGPFENVIAWSQDGLVGTRRFLERVNGLADHVGEESHETTTLLHKTLKKVAEDIEGFKFNTAISAMMIFLNQAEKTGLSKESYLAFLRLLAPFAPHLTEELWVQAGQAGSVHTAIWPTYVPELAQDKLVTIGVQINGKMRGEVTLDPQASEEEAMSLIQKNPTLEARLAGLKLQRVIYVPGKIINIIVVNDSP
jgi:leucyl-tRNA synthetase